MAEGIREIKLRIKSVKNIQQIARAMEMVAAARLRKMQIKLFHLRNYLKEMEEFLSFINLEKISHPYMEKDKNVKRICLIVFSGERGLCGSYNSNLIRQVENFLNVNKHIQIKLLISGRKIFPYFAKSGYDVEVFPISGASSYKEVNLKTRFLKEQFLNNQFQQINVLYTEFLTTANQRTRIDKLLPMDLEKKEGRKIIFEPEEEKILKDLLDHIFEIKLLCFATEAKTSEEAQRMLSMRAASDNAQEAIEKLTLTYNKLRQTLITKEIIEITSSAEAIK